MGVLIFLYEVGKDLFVVKGRWEWILICVDYYKLLDEDCYYDNGVLFIKNVFLDMVVIYLCF